MGPFDRPPTPCGPGGRGTKSVPKKLLYTPRPVNSRSFTLSGGFTRAMLDREKRCSGAITYDVSTASVPPTSNDLSGVPLTGSATLVDFNYVLMAGHTLDGLSTLSQTAMPSGMVRVVFSNEFTAATVDTCAPQMEPTRPFATLRADLESWSGSANGLDYALVKIEWPANTMIAGPMPTLPDPATFHDSELKGKPVLFLGQYTQDDPPPPPRSPGFFDAHVVVAGFQHGSDRACGWPRGSRVCRVQSQCRNRWPFGGWRL